VKYFEKVKHICSACKRFLNCVFYSFFSHFSAVFENAIFNTMKIMRGTFLDSSLSKKCFLKGDFGEI
jgi:hypothetical protein